MHIILFFVLQCKLISEMDNCFTVPMFGYPSLDEYYSMAMMGDKLRDIKRPVLAVNAIDDPFVPGECKLFFNELMPWYTTQNYFIYNPIRAQIKHTNKTIL